MIELPTIKVLLIEDDEDDFIIARETLNEIDTTQFDLSWVSEFEQARQAIARQEHDIYLIDYRLGPHTGLELLTEAIAHDCRAPIILLTGLGNREMDQAAMKAGAADYLIKGQITPALLERSIHHSIQRKETELKLRASEERLRQSQKMEAMGTLAGGIAHDFNNILAIISGYAVRLKKPNLSPGEVAADLAAIEQTAQRGAGLVRQILTFARKAEVKAEQIDLHEVIREMVKMLEETFPRTIRFRMELSPEMRPLLGDVSQLHQTFLNLCVNARDAMPDGGTIRIRTQVIPPERLTKLFQANGNISYAEIAVEDTGTGMDEKTRSRIFEPFFTTKGREKGTGLGLAVVYGIVKHHNGAIDVESTMGKGTVIRIFLPLQQGPLMEQLPVKTLAEAAHKGTETILFVEDEELLLSLMQTLLEEQGYRVITARDGAEAVDLYRSQGNNIDLVITDMGLPILGGWEVFEQIRQVNPQAKILLASGYIDPELKGRVLKAGAYEVLQKPYVASELFQEIRRVFDSSAQATTPGT